MTINLTDTHDGEYKDIVINGTRLAVFQTGKIYRMSKCGYWKHIQNTANSTDGYNYIGVGRPEDGNKKMITRHRIMGYAFLNLDIENPKILMDHIDGIRTNNDINNLRLYINKIILIEQQQKVIHIIKLLKNFKQQSALFQN